MEGHKKVPKVAHFGCVRGLALGAILQNFISLSIQGVRSSFLVEIEAEVKEISHIKLILKIDVFKGMFLVSKCTTKYQNSCFGILGSQVQTPRTEQVTTVLSMVRWDGCNEVISALKQFPGLALR